jgi:hypothetical protein
MAYASADELATALNTRVTTANQPILEACLDAAAEEIDHSLDRIDPLPDPVPAVVARTNVNRACEWYKAPDTANGGVGFDQIGSVQTPSSGFERHAAAILSAKQQFGVG